MLLRLQAAPSNVTRYVLSMPGGYDVARWVSHVPVSLSYQKYHGAVPDTSSSSTTL